jgi:uncharacterized protein (DUF1330 family)
VGNNQGSGSDIEQLDTYELSTLPNPLRLLRALLRPGKPFVMVNLLVFREKATGEYAHLSGREAYEIYAQSVGKAQAPLGSRLLWSGEVKQQIVGDTNPVFQTIGLLEYASPKAFLRFATKGNSDTSARSAGLLGQWLLASTTMELGEVPTPTGEDVVLFELLGFTDGFGKTAEPWRGAWQFACQAVGAQTIWRGHCDHHVLGKSSPKVDEIVMTWFPNVGALEQALNSPQVMETQETRDRGVRPYLGYTATSIVDFLPVLS